VEKALAVISISRRESQNHWMFGAGRDL